MNPMKETMVKKEDGRELRAEERRSRILNAATKLFAEKGPEGTRVDEIAEVAGINKRMIYHYFESKDNLYVEVLRNNYNKIFTISKRLMNPENCLKDNIARAIRAYFYFLAENDEFVRLTSWEALNGGRYIGKAIPRFFDLFELEFGDMIKEGIRQRLIRPNTDFRQVLLSIHALCLSYFNRREIIQPIWEKDMLSAELLEARLQHILTLIFNGIANYEEEKSDGCMGSN